MHASDQNQDNTGRAQADSAAMKRYVLNGYRTAHKVDDR